MLSIFNMQRGTPAGEAVDVHNNQPHIVRFMDAAGDIPPTHFIAIEQELVLECRSIDSALFMMLATQYVFMEYHPKVRDVLYYFQDKVLVLQVISHQRTSLQLSKN